MKTKKTKKYGPRGYYGDPILKKLTDGKPHSVMGLMKELKIPAKKFSTVYRLVRTIVSSPMLEFKTEKVPSTHGPRTLTYRAVK